MDSKGGVVMDPKEGRELPVAAAREGCALSPTEVPNCQRIIDSFQFPSAVQSTVKCILYSRS